MDYNAAMPVAPKRAASDLRFWFAAAAVVALAFTVRFHRLDVSTITHPEVYAPGIRFHDFASQPTERASVSAIVHSSLVDDNHPPGFYFAMLPWTSAFGTSEGVLRTPAAVIGVLSVLGVLAWSWRREGPAVATLAAGWLALHGQHVLWSRHARMWVLCTAMGVLTALALERLREAWTSGWAATYLAATSVGLWADYTYWPLLAAQMVWVIAVSRAHSTLPAMLSLQAFAVVVGSPVFVFLMSRLGSSAYLDAPAGNLVGYFLAFDGWFDPETSERLGSRGGAGALVAALAGAVLFAVGFAARPAVTVDTAATAARRLLPEWILAAGIVWPLALAWVWRHQPTDDNYPVWPVTLSIPLIVAAGHYVLRRSWPWLSAQLRRCAGVPVLARLFDDACAMQAMVPFLILLAASPVLPAVAPRTTLVLAPFFLIVVSRGLFSLVRAVPGRLAAAAVVLALGWASTYDVLTAPPVRDYKGMGTALLARSQPGTVYVIQDAWYLQPLHYYLSPSAVTAIPTADPVNAPAMRRAWTFGVGDDALAMARAAATPLVGFTETDHVEMRDLAAILVERLPSVAAAPAAPPAPASSSTAARMPRPR